VLREAIKVLAAKGMVESRTKIGTRVRARDHWNMLDPDVLSWSLASHQAESYAAGVSEMRHILEPAGAALAAERATAEQLARIREAYEAMAAAGDDLEQSIPHDLRFHQAILEATGNTFLASMGHMIESALAFSFQVSARARDDAAYSLPLHKAVLERIEARDARGAQAAMLRLLENARDEIERILDGSRDKPAAQPQSQSHSQPQPRRLRQATR
ncbi:MAG TPA: FCD domain-containing protein, partial [Alphaproteobacteria bacterium]|nr:FCD domain-containing protein [Alphaproteobacteria bacterium]